MKKLCEIEACWECVNHNHRGLFLLVGYCMETGNGVGKGKPIPEWCPLPDAEEKECD